MSKIKELQQLYREKNGIPKTVDKEEYEEFFNKKLKPLLLEAIENKKCGIALALKTGLWRPPGSYEIHNEIYDNMSKFRYFLKEDGFEYYEGTFEDEWYGKHKFVIFDTEMYTTDEISLYRIF